MRTHPGEVNNIDELSVLERNEYERFARRSRSKRNRALRTISGGRLGLAPPPSLGPAGRGPATTEDPPPAEAHVASATGNGAATGSHTQRPTSRSASTSRAGKGVVGETVPPPAPAFPPMGAAPVDAGSAAAPDPDPDIEVDDLDLAARARPHRLRHRIGVGQSIRATVTVFVALPMAAVLVAVTALLVAVSRPTPTATGGGASGVIAVGPAGFAQQFVAAWLRAGDQTADSLKTWYPGPVDLTGKVPDATYAITVVAVQVTSQGSTSEGAYWSVLVAADVAERPPTAGQGQGAYQDGGIHYYRVGVWQRPDQTMAATGLPAEEAAPRPAATPDPLVAADQPPDPSDPRVDTLSRWANALLTGQGELGRYQNPDVPAAPVTPPPFRRLIIRGVGYAPIPGAKDTGGAVAARVVLTGIDAQNNEQVLDYSVRLGLHDQRWYVTRVALAPALSPTRAAPGGSR